MAAKGIEFALCSLYLMSHLFSSAYANSELEFLPVLGSKICMELLGCFELTEEFINPKFRPISLLPQDRSVIDTKFGLYTRKNPEEYQVYNLNVSRIEDIKNSPVNSNHTTIFLVHGFLETQSITKWWQRVKTSLLLNKDYNVIIVDWFGGALPPYAQAVANTRVVGAEIALMFERLKTYKKISSKNTHIVGHSLGSHAAAYAGQKIKDLKRITALDPAGPYFANMPASVKLDPTDANFVDAIHTGCSVTRILGFEASYGMTETAGHIDFYPNGGYTQPGCEYRLWLIAKTLFSRGIFEAIRQAAACNHERSVDYFIKSINYYNPLPTAYKCKNWNDYQNGLCSTCGEKEEDCAIMGMKADHYKLPANNTMSSRFFLYTSAHEPYWVYTYMIKIQFCKLQGAKRKMKGIINLDFHGTKQKNSTLTVSFDTKKGETFNTLLNTEKDLGEIRGVTFSWKSLSWNPFVKKKIYLQKIEIFPMYGVNNSDTSKKAKWIYQGHCDKPIMQNKEILL